MELGRISDDDRSYCYAVRTNTNIVITADRGKNSDIFNILY